MVLNRKMFNRLLLAVTLPFFNAIASAQDYPSKPVRIIVPTAPAGGVDGVARIVSQKLQEKWGISVTVENRAGASGAIGAEAVFRAAPDGYTLLVATPGALVTNKLLIPKLAYDSDAFAPVSVIAESPQVLVANAKVGAETLQSLLALGKAKPELLNYGSPGNGTVPQLAFELLKATAGVKIVHVPFKGNAPALAALLGGQVEMIIDAISTTRSGVRAGTLRALAVTGAKRHPSMPSVPTVSEVLPGFLAIVWYGMVAPPGTSSAITGRISAAVAEALKQPDAAKRLQDMNVDPVGGTPGEMAQFVKRESEVWGNIIRTAGITSD